MNGNIFLYTGALFVLVLVVSVYFKRAMGISYDRKALLSNLIAFLTATVAYFLGDLDIHNLENLSDPHKVFATIVLILIINGVIQFGLWITYALLHYRRWLKLPRFVFDILAFFIVVVVILILIGVIFNKQLTGVLVTSTVGAAVIGLALQDTLSNLFSGISLQIESPFNIDDWVNLGGFEGKVVDQNWRTVTILSRENHRISLTNRFVSEDKIVNFSRPTRRQIHNFFIVLDYSHPPNRVKNVLKNLLNEIDEVEIDGNLGVFVTDYMDSGVKYCLRYWLYDYADILYIQDVVLSRLWYTLSRHKIKIPYPTSEIQMQVVEDSNVEIISLEDDDILQFLNSLDWLRNMDNERIRELSDQCRHILFAKDDIIVHQGATGNSMYIIYKGGIRVLVEAEGQQDIEVAQKEKGEFFGELSLLTGEPRTASIKAREDCQVLVIDKESFSTLLLSDKQLLEQFLDGLEHCKSGIADAITNEASKENSTQESARKVIFNKVWSFLMGES